MVRCESSLNRPVGWQSNIQGFGPEEQIGQKLGNDGVVYVGGPSIREASVPEVKDFVTRGAGTCPIVGDFPFHVEIAYYYPLPIAQAIGNFVKYGQRSVHVPCDAINGTHDNVTKLSNSNLDG